MTLAEIAGRLRKAESARGHSILCRALVALTALAVMPLLSSPAALAKERAAVGSQKTLAERETTVGFWAGEAVPGTDWDSPDTYWKRRDTHPYTASLWRVLRRNRIPLYFNLRYRRDFGPSPQGSPSVTTR